jgi:hypothetical protein
MAKIPEFLKTSSTKLSDGGSIETTAKTEATFSMDTPRITNKLTKSSSTHLLLQSKRHL